MIVDELGDEIVESVQTEKGKFEVIVDDSISREYNIKAIRWDYEDKKMIIELGSEIEK